jgi:hypothetical protein
MGSFILRTRLEVLSSTLRDVERVMELAQDRAKEIDALKTLLAGPEGVRDLAKRLATRVERSLTDFQENDREAVLQNLTTASRLVQDLATMLEKSQGKIDSLLASPVELSTRRIQERLSTDKPRESIAELKKVLESAGPLTTAWEMEKRLATESEPLFAEYVDLLRGLALRETGIERGICELADRLLDGCDRPGLWKSLAIPSYRGPVEATPANIIHLGFPEWTIWALPLVAHEFGRMMVRENQTLARRVSQVPGAQALTPATLVDVLGDAFAMYTVGPAYACAAVLMRLDPRPAGPGQQAVDDSRARMIFEMLTEAESRAGIGFSFEAVRRPIEQAWLEAVQEAGATPSAEPASADLARLFWDWADQTYYTAKYQPMSWQKAHRLQEALARRIDDQPAGADDAATITTGTGDVRDMLNAAWLFRLRAPGRADAIASGALAAWQQAMPKPQGAAGFAVHGTVQPGGRTS